MKCTLMSSFFITSADLPYGSTDGYGFVYVVAKSANGPSKVGISINARKRVSDLENANGERFSHIWLSRQCSNFRALEAAIHEAMRGDRGIGEWFNVPFTHAVNHADGMKYDTVDAVDDEEMHKISNRVKPPSDYVCAMAIEIEKRMGLR